MAEYIEREALMRDIGEGVVFTVARGQKNTAEIRGANKVIDRIKAAPAADVAEVRHGEWIYHECVSSYDGAKSGFACSVCSGFVEEDIFDMDEFNKAFCGACGAKMDGKGDGE